MRRPPECVAVVAKHHWLTGGTMLLFVALVYGFTRNSRLFEFSRKAYAITLTIGGLYVVTGALVWLGTPLGRLFNYACSLIYLARPALGLRLWKIAGSAEFKTYFTGSKTRLNSEARKP